MDIIDVFTAILEIVGTGFIEGWEVLFDIQIEWFMNMTFGDIVVSVIGVSMFMKVMSDVLFGGGNMLHGISSNRRATRRYNRAQGKARARADITPNKQVLHNMGVSKKAKELASARKRGL